MSTHGWEGCIGHGAQTLGKDFGHIRATHAIRSTVFSYNVADEPSGEHVLREGVGTQLTGTSSSIYWYMQDSGRPCLAVPNRKPPYPPVADLIRACPEFVEPARGACRNAPANTA